MSYRHALVDVLDYIDYLWEDGGEVTEDQLIEGYVVALDEIRTYVLNLIDSPEDV